MHNPELADKLLTFLQNHSRQAIILKLENHVMLDTCHEINRGRNYLITISNNYDKGGLSIVQNNSRLADFLNAGGFPLNQQTAAKQKEPQEERNRFELERLRLEIYDLKQRSSERKNTRLISIIA